MKSKINKRGAIGEGVLMIYRLVLVAVIAIIILGLSAIYYDYYIYVRGAESSIMAKQVYNCLAFNGEVNMDGLPKEAGSSILKYCGFGDSGRFYVKVTVRDIVAGKETVFTSEDGSSKETKKIYLQLGEAMKTQAKYEPGYKSYVYPVNLIVLGKEVKGNLAVEVYAGSEI